MDRLIYIAMTGASENFAQQAVAAHNLANVNTTGYRADTSAFRVVPVVGPGLATRAYAVETTPGADLSQGTITQTGRDLDVAVHGQGWIAVQGLDGQEAYTRDGSLQVGPDGQLQTPSGLPVLSEGGPIIVPQDSKITVGTDGTVSAAQIGQEKSATVVGQIKLVNPDAGSVVKSSDGLFRTQDGSPASADSNVQVVPGSLEGSNVNAISAMVDMISLARQFDAQMKLLQNAQSNAQSAAQLMSASS